jgi:hypothetical protein
VCADHPRCRRVPCHQRLITVRICRAKPRTGVRELSFNHSIGDRKRDATARAMHASERAFVLAVTGDILRRVRVAQGRRETLNSLHLTSRPKSTGTGAVSFLTELDPASTSISEKVGAPSPIDPSSCMIWVGQGAPAAVVRDEPDEPCCPCTTGGSGCHSPPPPPLSGKKVASTIAHSVRLGDVASKSASPWPWMAISCGVCVTGFTMIGEGPALPSHPTKTVGPDRTHTVRFGSERFAGNAVTPPVEPFPDDSMHGLLPEPFSPHPPSIISMGVRVPCLVTIDVEPS